jgi:glutamyl-tRNA reductase
MTGLDHSRAEIDIREAFAVTKEKTREILETIRDSGKAGGGPGGCVILSTCNRTEFYASVPERCAFDPAKALCGALDRDHAQYARYFAEKKDGDVMRHLCRVASGLDSQIIGDDQIITQAREAAELSRASSCADSYLETLFRLAIQGAKAIKTRVILPSLGAGSAPAKAAERLKAMEPLAGREALVIGNGQMGRLMAELLLREGTRVTVTLREYKKGLIHVPDGAGAVSYSERYQAAERADIVISATASPHFTLTRDRLAGLARLPSVFVDLAVPRDLEPSVSGLPGVTLLTIEDLAGEGRGIPPECAPAIDGIVEEFVERYRQWQSYKENAARKSAGIY